MTEETLMPYGKYMLRPAREVPESYFNWLCIRINKYAPNKRTFSEKEILEYAINKFGKQITEQHG